MPAQNPKKYIDHLQYRKHAVGKERRLNMSKAILEHGTPLPRPIEYSDIDIAFFNWVDKVFPLVNDGELLPTYKLFSTQRLSEYAQTWQNLDSKGNLVLNFKSVTRENNPQKGESQGGYFNIPGHKDFAMFYVPVLQDNGVEAYDKYTIKQPFAVNFMYKVSIFTNKYELLNKMNESMQYEFSALNCYIAPNEHPMPMTLESVSDESEYTIDDYKYYAQTYDIKVKGYIIRREDMKVERIASRLIMQNQAEEGKRQPSAKGKVEFIKWNRENTVTPAACDIPPYGEPADPNAKVKVKIEPWNPCGIEEESDYYNKIVKIFMHFDECTSSITFTIDKEIVLDSVETDNVYDFRLLVNGEVMNLENEVKLYDGDSVEVKITRDDMYRSSDMTLIGYDPNVVIDKTYLPESSLDENDVDEEDIEIGVDCEEEEKAGE